jgi:hypothetical protein
LRQGDLQGLGAGAVDEVAEVELGLSEGVLAGTADQQAGDGEDIAGEGLGDVGGELLGLGFLFSGQWFLHDALTDRERGFLAGTAHTFFVYKDSTNWRYAHTKGA